MKRYFTIIFSAVLMTACAGDFLDKTPLDKLSEDAVFNDEALAESYVNALYSVLPDPFQEGNIGCISDEGYFRYGGTSTRYVADGSMTPSNVMYINEGGQAHNSRTTTLNIWNRAYEWIYRMNYFINYLTENGTEMDEAAAERLLGEVYYLRAWAYYNLIQRYAGVPIITKAYGLDETYSESRANYDDCVNFILDDLDRAEDLVPSKENCSLGRINKDVILALRSRVTLVAASPLFNDPENPEGSIFRGAYDYDGKWQRAYDAAKAIVDRADVDGAYSLDDTYDGFWKDANSPELIWAKYFTSLGASKAQLYYSIVYFNGYISFQPTQAMIMDYEMTNGKKFFEEGSGYDPEHPFDNRDPRFYYSVATPFRPYGNMRSGTYEEPKLELYFLFDNCTRDDFAAGKTEPTFTSRGEHMWANGWSESVGLGLNKWYIPTAPVTESEVGSLLYPWFRLGEMYLNLAECAYMLGKEDECRTYINKVRQRSDVMMPPVTDSGESLWDRVVNERRIEMAFEFVRYFDVRRWKTAPFYENIPWAGMRTMILQKGNQRDTLYRMVRTYDESKNNTTYYWPNTGIDYNVAGEPLKHVFTYRWLGKDYRIDYGDCYLNMATTQKHFPEKGGVYPNYLMPIPANEMAKANGTLVQNPGY